METKSEIEQAIALSARDKEECLKLFEERHKSFKDDRNWKQYLDYLNALPKLHKLLLNSSILRVDLYPTPQNIICRLKIDYSDCYNKDFHFCSASKDTVNLYSLNNILIEEISKAGFFKTIFSFLELLPTSEKNESLKKLYQWVFSSCFAHCHWGLLNYFSHELSNEQIRDLLPIKFQARSGLLVEKNLLSHIEYYLPPKYSPSDPILYSAYKSLLKSFLHQYVDECIEKTFPVLMESLPILSADIVGLITSYTDDPTQAYVQEKLNIEIDPPLACEIRHEAFLRYKTNHQLTFGYGQKPLESLKPIDPTDQLDQAKKKKKDS